MARAEALVEKAKSSSKKERRDPKRKREEDSSARMAKSSPTKKQSKRDDKSPSKKQDKKDEKTSRETWSKSKKKRMRAIRAKQAKKEASGGSIDIKKDQEEDYGKSARVADDDVASRPVASSSSALQEAFKARLTGSRFRILNEELYTTESSAAFKRFKESPELFDQYHEGFRHQVEAWPVNPVDVIVSSLKKLASAKFDGDEQMVVADFGCGDAELAKQLLNMQIKKKCPFVVHSFDLVAGCDLVTACDMANVPLPGSSVDVAVFCLALMGTNLADFIREAHRVLREHGRLKIAEVRSRFETKNDRDGKNGLDEFLSALTLLGFECVKTDRSNKMFIVLELKKNGKKPKKKLEFTAKPCIYKRR